MKDAVAIDRLCGLSFAMLWIFYDTDMPRCMSNRPGIVIPISWLWFSTDMLSLAQGIVDGRYEYKDLIQGVRPPAGNQISVKLSTMLRILETAAC